MRREHGDLVSLGLQSNCRINHESLGSSCIHTHTRGCSCESHPKLIVSVGGVQTNSKVWVNKGYLHVFLVFLIVEGVRVSTAAAGKTLMARWGWGSETEVCVALLLHFRLLFVCVCVRHRFNFVAPIMVCEQQQQQQTNKQTCYDVDPCPSTYLAVSCVSLSRCFLRFVSSVTSSSWRFRCSLIARFFIRTDFSFTSCMSS